MEISKGQQLYVNNKWYMDVIDVNDTKVKVRIKYYEGVKKDVYFYKEISLPKDLFTNLKENEYIVYTKVNQVELKKIIGSLINKLIKEDDITKMFEDGSVGAGMGAVSNPGLSGTPGVVGNAGSGDVSGSVLPGSSNEFALEIHPKVNKKIRKKLKTKAGKAVVKQPVIELTENVVSTEELTENEYKSKVYAFLDYPTDNEYDHKFIQVVNKIRPSFLDTSGQRIKQYFKNLYNMNKSLIKLRTSDWFQNYILVLADIEDTEEL